MSKFIKRVMCFLIPIFLIIGVFFYIDPYNVIRKEKNPKLEELKDEISKKINYSLFKLQDFHWNPTDVILLGDSRTAGLGEESFDKIADEKVKNLAIGGGTIKEAVETFWTVNDMHKLKKVYIGINFNLYNAYNNRNSVIQANTLRKSTGLYLTSKYCIESSFLIIKSLITTKKVEIEKPKDTRESFWKNQLESSGPEFYMYYNDLKAITNYCLSNNISLIFFIPPSHTDLQAKITEYKREEEYKRFKLDLASLGAPVYDFHFSNSMSEEKENFGDPFHFRDKYRDIIIEVISTEKKEIPEFNNVYRLL